MGSAVPGEAKQESTRSKEGSVSDAKWQEPQRKEAAGDVVRSDDRGPLAVGRVKTSKVGVRTACDVQNTGAAEAGDLKDEMSIYASHDVMMYVPEGQSFVDDCRRIQRWQNHGVWRCPRYPP